MPTKLKTLASFIVPYLQYLDEHSQPTQTLPEFATNAFLVDLYQRMMLLRLFDTQMVNLHRTGKIGTFPSSLGQEAIFIPVGMAMKKEDVLCPFYRDHGVMIQRGYALTDILAYWSGDERGNASAAANQDFPCCVPIATQCLHATGVAYAIKYRKEKRVVVTEIGDGGTSKGDFYEALNLAGTWQLPMVFVIDNNQWAISVPREKQSSCETLAQKAIAAGLDCIQVDGNDVIAVFETVTHAINQARNGGKATVIEAVTYRLADHTTVDDASRYADPEIKKVAWKKEPIARLGYYLEAQGVWDKNKEAELQHTTKAFVEKEIEAYFSVEKQKPESLFDYMYETLPEALIDQRNDLLDQIIQ
ncbi:MAG: pyruvate dehydrogenase (acetyl-transferring) E1 component subunit alpha [Gammaproteobacteria bacterium CG_4_10_14_0_8_um_filter_38_16]|nr:MAG: pyruvate dehydrogenase (acetyl-transferring) E1 component subunit alpha [Gammaproteobacteria bacterium CG_4_10_14_0_8_um_filter_38_16]PJA03541.1 MAG: pyruvate dehydrogenase (acetyl-transferring) E1 component subunit alpha [Gammaproteobacteria bacterium CG_4_10_14_0_2_um_filter_38_22]PJB11163.1 MAG: pyruvate dehydrogenase (acetyl-transferring) E1 component subunit alpha [Gammaproteobacteria bacterium CG_4_9_14_3_um_filter_38_9]